MVGERVSAEPTGTVQDTDSQLEWLGEPDCVDRYVSDPAAGYMAQLGTAKLDVDDDGGGAGDAFVASHVRSRRGASPWLTRIHRR
jgi:hypothetical protein